MNSAASEVSESHSAIALPVETLPALASRSNTKSTSPERGTDTRGGLEGGERVLSMCRIVQQVVAQRNTLLFMARKDGQLKLTTL